MRTGYSHWAMRVVRKPALFLLLYLSILLFSPSFGSCHLKKRENAGEGCIASSEAADTLQLQQDLRGIKLLEEPLFPADDARVNESWRIYRTSYTISFNTNRGLANWVAYELLEGELEKRVSRRSGFIDDRDTQPFSLTASDYKGSGYSRGHLAPAADMRFSQKAQDEVSLMSNIAPQTQELNNGAWNTLEGRVRGWAQRYGSVYVVTGPLYLEPVKDRIAGRVQVPSHFFKALLVRYRGQWQGIGFVMPQFIFNKNIWDYAMSIDDLERIAQLDFFPLLPDAEELQMQRSVEPKVWGMPSSIPYR